MIHDKLKTYIPIVSWAIIIMTFPLVGFFVGWLVGVSRAPAVSALLPLIFGLIGGLSYGFLETKATAKKWLSTLQEKLEDKEIQKVTEVLGIGQDTFQMKMPVIWSVGVLGFCLMCYFGVDYGIQQRVSSIERYPLLLDFLHDIPVEFNEASTNTLVIQMDSSETRDPYTVKISLVGVYREWHVEVVDELGYSVEGLPNNPKLENIELHPGDKIEWKTSSAYTQGIIFLDKEIAQQYLDFHSRINDIALRLDGKESAYLGANNIVSSEFEFEDTIIEASVKNVESSERVARVEFQDILDFKGNINGSDVFRSISADEQQYIHLIWMQLQAKNVPLNHSKQLLQETLIPGMLEGGTSIALSEFWDNMEILSKSTINDFEIETADEPPSDLLDIIRGSS